MEYVLSYDSYKNENEWKKPEFFWNETSRCLRIGDNYIFVDKQVVLHENDTKLNELFGLDWSDLIPKTPSDWIHLGVDGVSAVISAIPGGKIISGIIDLIHAGAYWVEASLKTGGEAIGLTISGIITAIFAAIPGMGTENIISASLKKIIAFLTKSVVGRFLIGLLKYTIGLPFIISRQIIKFLFNLKSLRQFITKTLLKYEDTWLFSVLSKLPGVKQIINFFKKDVDIILNNAEKYIAQDLKMYTNALKTSVLNSSKEYYNGVLSEGIKKFMTQDQFTKTCVKKAELELSQMTSENLAKNPDILLNAGKGFSENIIKSTTQDVMSIGVKMEKYIQTKYPTIMKLDKKLGLAIIPQLNKEIGSYVSKNGIKDTSEAALEQIAINVFKRLPKSVIKYLPGQLIKRAALVGTKNIITHAYSDDKAKEKEIESDTFVSNKSTVSPELLPIAYQEEDKLLEFLEKYNLKVGHVDNIGQLGDAQLEFRTPDKKGEDGKLIMTGTNYNEHDLTKSLDFYPTVDDLLQDLKFVNKQDEEEDSLKEGIYKKWERSSNQSTPWIIDENCRYEFHFLIRERSKISLFKKNHTEHIDFRDLEFVDDQAFQELNNSLYVIYKKVAK